MKVLHWALILVVIVFPISIVCRSLVNTRFSILKDEMRINNAIDTATSDAVDQIISANGFSNSGFSYDEEFGDVIDVSPALAQESVNTFFHTLAVNYNIPYQTKDTVSVTGNNTSYIQSYFAPYVPAVVVVAYDGFYIYSQEKTQDGTYSYKMSNKIPYAYKVGNGDYTIGYTLGNDVYLYDVRNGKMYSGRISHSTFHEVQEAFYEVTDLMGGTPVSVDDVAFVTNDMSVILYALFHQSVVAGEDYKKVLSLLEPNDSDVIDFLQDDVRDENGNHTIGRFHENRRNVIIQRISECLTEEINEQNQYANLMGVSYRFSLPTITQDDWINSINDISVLSFVQGIPLGTSEGTFFNSFALGGSQIVERRGYYCVDKAIPNGVKGLYHTRKSCPYFNEESYKFFVISREDAYKAGYVACQECN